MARSVLPAAAAALAAGSSAGLVQARARLLADTLALESAAEAALAAHEALAAAAAAARAGGTPWEGPVHGQCAIAPPALAAGTGAAAAGELRAAGAAYDSAALTGALALVGEAATRACGGSSLTLTGNDPTLTLGEGVLALEGADGPVCGLRADTLFFRRLAGALGGGETLGDSSPAGGRLAALPCQGRPGVVRPREHPLPQRRAPQAADAKPTLNLPLSAAARAPALGPDGLRAAAAALAAAAAEMAQSLQEEM